MALKHYKLVGREVVECGMLEAARDFEDIDKRMIASTLVDNLRVSTIFLFIDHGPLDGGPPQHFETMVFNEHDTKLLETGQWTNRYATYQQALNGHNYTVDELRKLYEKSKEFTYTPD